ncbi:MAG TPA: isocitrate lyase/phosphoenolpyruvate mutase family protein [Pyrinomonadaceae bacterium]|nr:isocitrate lyase/phosphoenolpyruvate mutase family protein [Pyrinomonadaceae bacterium]
MTNQLTAVERFRELHQSGCFVLPNPWDAGSALYLEHLGFEALATTSAGFAFAQGYADGPTTMSRESVLEHFRQIAAATNLPVNADFQNGYADEPVDVANSVKLCVETGVAGLSIEDSTGREGPPLYDFELAVERIKAARRAIDDSNVPVLLTARCEAWLVGDASPLQTSLQRLTAFAEAGADCLYAPGVTKSEEISAIVKAVAPKAVNVLVSTNNCTTTVAQLADLGVRRISVGAALSRVAWGSFIRAAQKIKNEGSFEAFAEAAPFNDLMKVFASRSLL